MLLISLPCLLSSFRREEGASPPLSTREKHLSEHPHPSFAPYPHINTIIRGIITKLLRLGIDWQPKSKKNKIIKQALPYLALYHSKPTWPSMKWAFFLLPDPEGLVLSGWILTWGEGLLISNFSAWTGVGTFIRERDTEGFVVLPNPV